MAVVRSSECQAGAGEHIPARFAPLAHRFASAVLSPHLDRHRPCLFATPVADADGRIRKVYRDRDVARPYERLRSIDGAERFGQIARAYWAIENADARIGR